MSTISLCENCNARADGSPTKVVIDGGTTEDGVWMGRQEFPHRLCRECLAAVIDLDFVTYTRRHDERPRELALP